MTKRTLIKLYAIIQKFCTARTSFNFESNKLIFQKMHCLTSSRLADFFVQFTIKFSNYLKFTALEQ